MTSNSKKDKSGRNPQHDGAYTVTYIHTILSNTAPFSPPNKQCANGTYKLLYRLYRAGSEGKEQVQQLWELIQAQNPELARQVAEYGQKQLEAAESVKPVDPDAEFRYKPQPLPEISHQGTEPDLPLPACPTLPDIGLEPELGKQAGQWLNHYMDYANQISPRTPDLFHESAALMLGSILVARRLKLPMAFADIFPNLFVQWVARSGHYKKTTALDILRKLIKSVGAQYLLHENDMTPEAMISGMAGQKNPTNFEALPNAIQKRITQSQNYAAQRSMIRDESSGLLAAASKDYNGGLIEFMLSAFDCSEYSRRTISRGSEIIEDIYFSFLGASTPSGLGRFLNDERLRHNGWWARFAILTPDAPRSRAKPAAVVTMPDGLVSGIQHLLSRLPQNATLPLTVTFGAGAFALWDKYNDAIDDLMDTIDEQHDAQYNRFGVQVLKVAMLLAAWDWKDTPAPIIEMAHMTRAIQIVESWRASYHRAMEETVVSETQSQNDRVLHFIRAQHDAKGVSTRDISRHTRLPYSRLRLILDDLLAIDEIRYEGKVTDKQDRRRFFVTTE